MKGFQSGKNHWNWKGGKILRRGYILIRNPEHPNSCNGYILEHRFLVEKHIGRYLGKHEIVHHINGNPRDNRIDNLKLCSSVGEHLKHHYRKFHNLNNNEKYRQCSICHKIFKLSVSNFHKSKRSPYGLRYQCKKCHLNYARELYKKNNEKSFLR